MFYIFLLVGPGSLGGHDKSEMQGRNWIHRMMLRKYSSTCVSLLLSTVYES